MCILQGLSRQHLWMNSTYPIYLIGSHHYTPNTAAEMSGHLTTSTILYTGIIYRMVISDY